MCVVFSFEKRFGGGLKFFFDFGVPCDDVPVIFHQLLMRVYCLHRYA